MTSGAKEMSASGKPVGRLDAGQNRTVHSSGYLDQEASDARVHDFHVVPETRKESVSVIHAEVYQSN
jgi:hypothetical protein